MTTQSLEADTQALVEDLNRVVQGEVKFDRMTRYLYSTDASLYLMEPVGVVLPKTNEDVIAVVETANKHNIPVLPRGGGTSLAGQTVANAIVMDFSKYMRNVIEINAEDGWVRTQPGIILDELNQSCKWMREARACTGWICRALRSWIWLRAGTGPLSGSVLPPVCIDGTARSYPDESRLKDGSCLV